MFKMWLKKRALFVIITSTLIGALFGFLVFSSNIKNSVINYNNTSLYENTDIDFNIPEPTKKQVEEISQMKFVDSVFPFYYTKSPIDYKDKKIKNSILISDYFKNIEITMYNSKRLIKKSINNYDNPAYIDYKFMSENNIKLDDEIIFLDTKFKVQGIYETNTYYDSAILLPLIGNQKTIIESKYKSYSACYLSVNDESAAENYLKTYKPLGRLKDRSEFDSDEAYEIHYNGWNKTNYYNEITNFNAKATDVKLFKITSNAIWWTLYIVLFLIIDIILFIRKGERVYFSKLKSKKTIWKYYLPSTILPFIISEILVIAGIFSIRNGIDLYVKEVFINSILIESAISTGIGIILLLIMHFAYIKFYKYKNR